MIDETGAVRQPFETSMALAEELDNRFVQEGLSIDRNDDNNNNNNKFVERHFPMVQWRFTV